MNYLIMIPIPWNSITKWGEKIHYLYDPGDYYIKYRVYKLWGNSMMTVLLKDEKTCAALREYYQRIWDSGYSDLAKVKEKLIDKT